MEPFFCYNSDPGRGGFKFWNDETTYGAPRNLGCYVVVILMYLHYPQHPCMVYLPAFVGWFLEEMQVNIPYMDGMGYVHVSNMLILSDSQNWKKHVNRVKQRDLYHWIISTSFLLRLQSIATSKRRPGRRLSYTPPRRSHPPEEAKVRTKQKACTKLKGWR